jgi:hypothetical protein
MCRPWGSSAETGPCLLGVRRTSCSHGCVSLKVGQVLVVVHGVIPDRVVTLGRGVDNVLAPMGKTRVRNTILFRVQRA